MSSSAEAQFQTAATFQERSLRSVQHSERWLGRLFALLGSVPIVIAFAIVVVFAVETVLFFQNEAVSVGEFFLATRWTPLFASMEFGISVLIVATVLVAVIALGTAVPAGLLAAVYLSEYAGPRQRRFLKPTIDALGGIPTVIYGYFALLFVTPLLKQWLFPDIASFNALSAGLVVGILIAPTVAALSEDALRGVPPELREGAYALGFTKSETIIKVLLPAAWPGILSSFTLATSRALGETMIVAIAAGQLPELTFNPLVPIETMTGFIIQVSLGSVTFGSLAFQTIFTVGMVLFVITFLFNSFGYWLLRRSQQQTGQLLLAQAAPLTPTTTPIRDRESLSLVLPPASPRQRNDTWLPAKPLPLRFGFDWGFRVLSLLVAFGGIFILGVLIYVLAQGGWWRLSWSFLTSFASRRAEDSGILAPLVGTMWLLGLTGLFVFPLGVGGAIYLEEYRSDNWFNRLLEAVIANLTAVPSILYGLLGLELFVRIFRPVTGGNTILAGALTLTVMVLPTLIVASRTALRRASPELRQGGYAVGMTQWQVLRTLVIPSAIPGIVTGMLLSLSLVIGETAALIGVGAIASVRALPAFSWAGLQSQYNTLPVQIFYWLQSPKPAVQANAAAATLVLIAILLLVNLAAVLLREFVERRLQPSA